MHLVCGLPSWFLPSQRKRGLRDGGRTGCRALAARSRRGQGASVPKEMTRHVDIAVNAYAELEGCGGGGGGGDGGGCGDGGGGAINRAVTYANYLCLNYPASQHSPIWPKRRATPRRTPQKPRARQDSPLCAKTRPALENMSTTFQHNAAAIVLILHSKSPWSWNHDPNGAHCIDSVHELYRLRESHAGFPHGVHFAAHGTRTEVAVGQA